MKRYLFLIPAVVAALLTGCYSDDTNTDYKTLDLPVIDTPENDLALTACRSRPTSSTRT